MRCGACSGLLRDVEPDAVLDAAGRLLGGRLTGKEGSRLRRDDGLDAFVVAQDAVRAVDKRQHGVILLLRHGVEIDHGAAVGAVAALGDGNGIAVLIQNRIAVLIGLIVLLHFACGLCLEGGSADGKRGIKRALIAVGQKRAQEAPRGVLVLAGREDREAGAELEAGAQIARGAWEADIAQVVSEECVVQINVAEAVERDVCRQQLFAG